MSSGANWTIEDEHTLRRLRKRGEKVAIIAALLNRTVGSISARCSELRITAKKRVPAESVMSINGPPIAEPCRWITDAENGAFKTLMAGRVYEDRRLKNGGLA